MEKIIDEELKSLLLTKTISHLHHNERQGDLDSPMLGSPQLTIHI